MTVLAELLAVSKRFGDVLALDRLDLEVREGERLALLGPNGAGKTTAIGLLLGLRRPDHGRARLFGLDPTRADARRDVGCTPQEMAFPGTLRVGEVADLVRAHYESPLDRPELLERFGLEPLDGRQVGGLSGGQKRRLACALAFAGSPRLVVLDEPTTGLDVEGRLAVWEAIRESGCTALLTTHSFEEADALATRIVFIAAGRAVLTAAPEELLARSGTLERAYLEATGGRV